MQTTSSQIDIKKYLFVLKRRWIMAATIFLAVMAVGAAYCLFWPPVYQATCLVVVQPQKVPGEIVKTTVTTRIEERLQIITQQVLSRTRLMEIIDRFDLFPKKRGKVTPDDLAEGMRKDITIKITRKNYFTITFVYHDRQTVAAVANALAAFYVDSNLRLREEDAVGTARFLERELKRMRGQLSEWESRITGFKQDHLQELPESIPKNLKLLEQLNGRFLHLDNIIQSERHRAMNIDGQIAHEQFRIEQLKIARANARRSGASLSGGGGPGEQDQQSPEAIQKEIDRLKVTYTDEHPDVRRLERILERAKAEKKRREAAMRAKAREEGLSEDELQKKLDESELELKSARVTLDRLGKNLAETMGRINKMKEEQAQLSRMMEEVQQRINNAPAVQEQLVELTRGYDELKQAHDKLQARYLEANMSANLERTQRGEQFEVVDPAQVPDQPFRPNVKRAIPLSAMVAVGLAVAVAFGLSFIDTSFTAVEQAERLSTLPVLVVVPWLATGREAKRRQKTQMILASIYAILGLFMLGVVGLLATGRGGMLKSLIKGITG